MLTLDKIYHAAFVLKDVARIELNEESFMGVTFFNGHAGTGLASKLSSGANVLQTTKGIKAELQSLAGFFPPGLKHAYADDRAPIWKNPYGRLCVPFSRPLPLLWR